MNKNIIVANLIAAALVSNVAFAGATDKAKAKIDNAVEALDETAATAAIKSKYAADSLLNPFGISVTVDNKTAFLKGQVDTDMQYDKAVYLASSIKGIDDVNTDDLKVKDSQHPVKDMLLTARVKGALIKDAMMSEKEADAWPFTIETKDGVVYVKGTVRSEEVKTNAVKTIEAVKGVKSVEQSITVEAK